MKVLKNLKDVIVGCQQGQEADKEALMVRFLPLIRKMARCSNQNISREDLEQDLWVYFWQCVADFDVEKAEYFPPILCKRLDQHRKYLFRSWSRHHQVEGMALETAEEKGYTMDTTELHMAEWVKLLRQAGCTEKQVQVAVALAQYDSVKEACEVLGLSQQGLYRYKKVLKAVCEKHPKILKFLKTQCCDF